MALADFDAAIRNNPRLSQAYLNRAHARRSRRRRPWRRGRRGSAERNCANANAHRLMVDGRAGGGSEEDSAVHGPGVGHLPGAILTQPDPLTLTNSAYSFQIFSAFSASLRENLCLLCCPLTTCERNQISRRDAENAKENLLETGCRRWPFLPFVSG